MYIKSARQFKCSFDTNKRSLYRSFNSIFGKVGRFATENVVIQLLKYKCLPSVLYGLDACPINNTEIKSLDFALTRTLMKLFATKSPDVIRECQRNFNLKTLNIQINEAKLNFLRRYSNCENQLCQTLANIANDEQFKLSKSMELSLGKWYNQQTADSRNY